MASTSGNYRLFARAMRGHQQILCVYQGHPRELCPIILGHSVEGEEKALAYQFAGGSNSGLPPGGEWRCLFLAKVSAVELRDGPWHSGASHTRPHSCVAIVDLDVNPDSPYSPQRSLPAPKPKAARNPKRKPPATRRPRLALD